MELPGFAGCIAGDDTIMCALQSGADVDALISRINKVVNQ
jgi:arginine repressor